MLSMLARAYRLVLVLVLIERVVTFEAHEEKQQTVELRIYHEKDSNDQCAVFIHGTGRSNRADYTHSIFSGRRYSYCLKCRLL